MRALLVIGIAVVLPASSCFYPTEPEPEPSKCAPGYCYIRSAYTCCPVGFLNYAGAGYGCYSTRQACLNASGGKCWYETSCIR